MRISPQILQSVDKLQKAVKAEVVLFFGSRNSKFFHPDSDYDFFLVCETLKGQKGFYIMVGQARVHINLIASRDFLTKLHSPAALTFHSILMQSQIIKDYTTYLPSLVNQLVKYPRVHQSYHILERLNLIYGKAQEIKKYLHLKPDFPFFREKIIQVELETRLIDRKIYFGKTPEYHLNQEDLDRLELLQKLDLPDFYSAIRTSGDELLRSYFHDFADSISKTNQVWDLCSLSNETGLDLYEVFQRAHELGMMRLKDGIIDHGDFKTKELILDFSPLKS